MPSSEKYQVFHCQRLHDTRRLLKSEMYLVLHFGDWPYGKCGLWDKAAIRDEKAVCSGLDNRCRVAFPGMTAARRLDIGVCWPTWLSQHIFQIGGPSVGSAEIRLLKSLFFCSEATSALSTNRLHLCPVPRHGLEDLKTS